MDTGDRRCALPPSPPPRRTGPARYHELPLVTEDNVLSRSGWSYRHSDYLSILGGLSPAPPDLAVQLPDSPGRGSELHARFLRHSRQ